MRDWKGNPCCFYQPLLSVYIQRATLTTTHSSNCLSLYKDYVGGWQGVQVNLTAVSSSPVWITGALFLPQSAKTEMPLLVGLVYILLPNKHRHLWRIRVCFKKTSGLLCSYSGTGKFSFELPCLCGHYMNKTTIERLCLRDRGVFVWWSYPAFFSCPQSWIWCSPKTPENPLSCFWVNASALSNYFLTQYASLFWHCSPLKLNGTIFITWVSVPEAAAALIAKQPPSCLQSVEPDNVCATCRDAERGSDLIFLSLGDGKRIATSRLQQASLLPGSPESRPLCFPL